MLKRISRPSPSFALSLLARFVSLSGTAVAAGIVPLARHASPAYLDESGPTSDGTAWHRLLENDSTANGAFGNMYVTCVG